MALKNACDSNAALKRYFSTPTVRSMAQDTTQQPAPAKGKKKRNKLGYHRTSIACTHCRRRKIRCIAFTEVQNQCVDCIRLKKECTFQPVDQQPTHDAKSKTPPQAGVASQSCSPAFVPGYKAEMPFTVAFVPRSAPRATDTVRPTMPSPTNLRSTCSGQSANTPVPSGSQVTVPTLANVPSASTEPSQIGMPNPAGSGMGWGDSFSSEPSASGTEQYTQWSQNQDPPRSDPVPQWGQTNIEAGTQSNWGWAVEQPPSRSTPFSRDLMIPRQQQMMPVASGPLYQGVNEIKSVCGPDAVCARAWSNASQFAARGVTPPQQGFQQMVLQHQQQNIYRPQPSGFYGWEFPDSTGP